MAIQNSYPALRPSLLLDFANSRQLDPRITFTRSTTATYYDGITTAKAEENLLINSTGNGTNSVSVTLTTSATTAPDGTSTAVKLTPTATNDRHIIYQYNATGTYGSGLPITASVFVKAGGYNYAQLGHFQDSSGANGGIIVDLTNGSITTVAGNLASYSATSVGNGWYRLAITFVATFSSGTGLIVAASNSGTPATTAGSPLFTGDGTSAIYFWGMQMEQRSSATAYTATTTQPITNYIPKLLLAGANQPRFDHNPTTGESLGFLIEEQRTNLELYSQEFTNASWTKTNCTVISSNNVTAPDGTLTASKITEGTGTVTPSVSYNLTSTNGVVYTISIYAKSAGRDYLAIDTYFIPYTTAIFNLSNGTVVDAAGTTCTITPVGNGWYRCTTTLTGAGYGGGPAFRVASTSGGGSYTGNGFNGIYVWGAQVETGAFATSYIPTTNASATRAADFAVMQGVNFSSWFNAREGTIIYNTSTGRYIQDGRLFWQIDNNISGYYQIFYAAYAVGGNYYPPTVIPTGSTSTGPNLNAFAFDTTSVAVSTNGSTAVTGSGLTYNFSSAARFMFSTGNVPVSKMAFYPKKLTNINIQSLTA